MPLPERSQLPLGDAAQFVASKCSVSIEAARTSLVHAFCDYDLRAVGYDRFGRSADIDWRAVRTKGRIDWETSAVEWPGRHRVEDITLARYLVEAWLPKSRGAPVESAPPTDAVIAVAEGDALEPKVAPVDPRPTEAQTEDDLKDWFVNVYVPAHKTDTPNPTRDAAFSAAQSRFDNYVDRTHLRDELRDIWKIHAPEG